MSTPVESPPTEATAEAVADAPTGRQCGRCRGWFAADPLLEPGGHQDWWACPPCRIAILGPSR